MVLHYFDVRDRLVVCRSSCGTRERRRAEAARHAHAMIAEGKKLGAPGLDRTIEVKDAEGNAVVTLRFADALREDAEES